MNPKDDLSVNSILNDIKNCLVDPENLTPNVRQLCVEALMLEGYQISGIAQLLKVSDRTIKRDLETIYEKNALNPSPDLAKKLIGEYLQKARIHHSYLMRLARIKEASIQEKSQAEYLASRVLKEIMQILQSLGYLPAAPTQIIGDFFHHIEEDDEKTLDDLKKKLGDLEGVASEFGAQSPELLEKFNSIKLKIKKAEIENEIKTTEAITKEIQNEENNQ